MGGLCFLNVSLMRSKYFKTDLERDGREKAFMVNLKGIFPIRSIIDSGIIISFLLLIFYLTECCLSINKKRLSNI